MGIQTPFDDWNALELINNERANAFERWVKNFVATGYQLANAGGLLVDVGQVGLNVAYVNGFEVLQTGMLSEPLAPLATNYVFVKFVKIPDPTAGTAEIVVALEVNTTGIPTTTDSLKLGEVDTDAISVIAIRPQDNRFKLHATQLEEDIEGNQKQILNLVTHKGVAFPTVPAPVAGQKFFRTDLSQEFFFDGVTWISNALGTNFAEDELTPGFNGQTVLALSSPMVALGMSVLAVNGVVYAEGTDYTIVGAVLTWLDTPFTLETTDSLIVKYQLT